MRRWARMQRGTAIGHWRAARWVAGRAARDGAGRQVGRPETGLGGSVPAVQPCHPPPAPPSAPCLPTPRPRPSPRRCTRGGGDSYGAAYGEGDVVGCLLYLPEGGRPFEKGAAGAGCQPGMAGACLWAGRQPSAGGTTRGLADACCLPPAAWLLPGAVSPPFTPLPSPPALLVQMLSSTKARCFWAPTARGHLQRRSPCLAAAWPSPSTAACRCAEAPPPPPPPPPWLVHRKAQPSCS